MDYADLRSDYHVALYVQEAKAELAQTGTILEISGEGDILSDEIKIGKRVFFDNKQIEVHSELEYDLQRKRYTFKTGELAIDKGEFEIVGGVDVDQKRIDLDFKGINTSFQTINSLLSSDLSKYFSAYRSKGEIYFAGRVSGTYDGQHLPKVSIDFGAKNASFFHPEYKKQIKDVNFTGHFDTGKRNHRSTYRLDFQDFYCSLEDKSLRGNFVLFNFDDYAIDLNLVGEADVNTLLLLFSREYVKTALGVLKMDLHINGKLENPSLTRNIQANGSLGFQNISFVLTGEKLPFNKINGVLTLRNNDLAISNLTGFVGNSDFILNGFINDISQILLTKDKTYQMQADFKSQYLDFDELLRSNFASRDTAQAKAAKYEFTILLPFR